MRTNSRSGARRRLPRRRSRWRWPFYLAVAFTPPILIVSATLGHAYVSVVRMIDERVHGERESSAPRVLARPFELRQGQSLTVRELVDRLNDLGYAHRSRAAQPGDFVTGGNEVGLIARGGEMAGGTIRVVFRAREANDPAAIVDRIERLELADTGGAPRTVDQVILERPLLTAVDTGAREKRRRVPLSLVPAHLVLAVLAIEDRRFYEHPGIDPLRAAAALATNLRGDRPYLVGGSTLTQQLVKNFFLTPEKTLARKLLEQMLALVLEQRLSKDEILELYLNEVYLGHRGSFAIHGVADAARLVFGKDVANVTLSEAATIAGTIQAPSTHSPFRNPEGARVRRNVVLRAMVSAGYLEPEVSARAAEQPLVVAARALDSEAPHFADFVTQHVMEQYPGLFQNSRALELHTTLDLHLQRIAHDAVRAELTRIDELAARSGRQRQPEAALIALDPRTGDILALVGGRRYNESQFNRALHARRQPGSVFKPFVFLAAFERAAAAGRRDLTPATIVADEPTVFSHGSRTWRPANYRNEYDGPITLRRALALSRNVATVKVAEATGYGEVAALWQRLGVRTLPEPYPSVALGVFEASPFEVATAYTLFPNLGVLRHPRAIAGIRERGREVRLAAPPPPQRIARDETTFLVTNMMRSVLTEGTAMRARTDGFLFDAAGKTGTTNDLRDAWFVGFTPELLTVVWVGYDNNQSLGLSGSQAALPIWTSFMKRALAGRSNVSFAAPRNISFVDIDPDTGKVAVPGCPRTHREAFLAGTEPLEECQLHRF